MQKFILSTLVCLFISLFSSSLYSQDCGIGALQIEVVECTPNNVFWIVLDFEYENVGDEGFRVQGNGNNYGNFEYADLPIEIGPLEANCEFIHEFVVIDNQFENCAEDFAFEEAVCCEEEQGDCFIGELEVDVVECNPNQNFWVIIDFDYENVGNEGFSLLGNGQDYGDFEYANLPIEIGPLEAGCNFTHEFVVLDNQDANCGQDFVFEEPACCEEECILEVVEISVGECDSLGFRQITFYVENQNTGTEGFDIYFYGVILGHFDYNSGPYVLQIPGDPFGHSLMAADSQNEDCSDSFYVETDECEYTPDCELNTVTPTIEFECISNTQYIAYANLDYTGSEDSLWISFYNQDNGLMYSELIAANDFPVVLGEFEISNDLYYFFIQGQNNPFCYTGNEWNDAPDCSENDECSITDLIIEAHECTTASGEIFVDIAFNVQNPSSNGFVVRGNGVIYDTFEYGQVFYTVGPILADCMTNYEFIVIDLENEDCAAEAYFEEPPCCGNNSECEIYDLVVDPLECNDDGTYSLWVNFEYENPGNDFFEVYAGNNQYIGFYSLADLPIVIDSFPGRDVMYEIIKVCINDVPDCCKTIEFLGPDCDNDAECDISEVFAEASECTAAGLFFIDFEFDVENPGDQGFIVLINGTVIDSFAYGQVFYTVGPIESMCDQLTEIKIIDLEHECYGSYTFDEPLCCGNMGNCEIYDIEVFNIECNNNGTYNLSINFQYENNTNEYFDLWSGNTFVGYFAYADLPIRIQNFPLRDAMYQFIKICDNDNPNCCAVTEFMGPDCDGEHDCVISDLQVLEANCTATGDLVLLIDFNYESTDKNGIDVFVNGRHVHYEREGHSPLDFRISDFDKTDSLVIRVCENDNPDCCDEIAYLFEEETADCELLEMLVLQTECIDDFFYLVVDAEHTFANDEKWFVLKGNGNNYGEYQLADLPVAIGPFHEEETINEMVMIMDGFEDCMDATEIDIECDCISNVVEVSNDQFTISETNAELRIESLNYSDFQIELYLLDGKKLLSANAYHQYVINKDNYAAGIYLLVIRMNSQEKSFKVFMSK